MKELSVNEIGRAELEFKFVPNEVESENMAHMWVEEEKENTQQILANLDREIEQLNRELLELDQDSEDDHLSEKAEQWAGSMFSDREQDWKYFRQNEGYINNIIWFFQIFQRFLQSNPTFLISTQTFNPLLNVLFLNLEVYGGILVTAANEQRQDPNPPIRTVLTSLILSLDIESAYKNFNYSNKS